MLASTAGGLWLTSFILTRALFAMGRERLIPAAFGRISRRHVPHVAILVTLGAALAVAGIQTMFSSLNAFFATVLASAGFFLVVEFFLDSTTAMVFLARGHRIGANTGDRTGSHWGLRIGSTVCSIMFGVFIVGFFVYGPRAIGSSIDIILAILLAGGVVFSLARKTSPDTFVFAGHDLRPDGDAAPGIFEAPTPVERP